MKKKILLSWNYDREDWIKPFRELSDEFEFIFLSKNSSSLERNTGEHLTKVYWNDYTSASHLLKEIKPDKVVFMSIIDAKTILLNAASKKKGISTHVLDHGLFYDNKTYLINRKNKVKGLTNEPQQGFSEKIKSLLFIFLSFLNLKISESARLLHYLFNKNKKSDIVALSKHKIEDLLEPTNVWCFTKHNGRIYLERDITTEAGLIEIGNPFIDDLFPNELTNNNLEVENYYLLIDSPKYAEDSPKEEKDKIVSFYRKINSLAKANNKKLIIKRHPFSFKFTHPLIDENISYVDRSNDLNKLLRKAAGVISFNSTLVLPALYYRPTCLIDDGIYNSFIEELRPHAHFVKFNSKHEDICFTKPEGLKSFLEEKYLYKADGRSLSRLRNQLNS